MSIRGSCLCGAITFEVDRIVGPAEFCHCNRCRKVSGSNALLTMVAKTTEYRFLTGRELVRSYDAPILYQPPAYRATFCGNCGSPVPAPDPPGDSMEIPAGAFDDDPGVKPDKYIFVELAPAWDDLPDDLPKYTLADLYKLRTGGELPSGFVMRRH